MAWMILIIAISAILFFYLLQKLLNLKKINKQLPPGPIGLPIIGHFHLLGKNPHQDLHHLSKRHGPIMHMRFGTVPTVIVSSATAAELFLKTHDIIFATKPHHEASVHLCYNQRNVIFGKYSPYWRDMRKLVMLELLSHHKVNQFQPMRRAELDLLIRTVKQAAEARETVDLSYRVASLTADMTCLMVFGKKYSDKELDPRKGFKALMKETMQEAAALNLGDYFPYLRWLDLNGSIRRLKNLSKIFDSFLEKIINEHQVQNKQGNKIQSTQDFVDTLMTIMESGEAGFEFDRRHVKAVLVDMLVAGMDTAAVGMEWLLSEIIRHPQVMKKLQKELNEIVGMDRMVEESHLNKLEYLNCVVKESMRLHPVAPLLIREAMEDCLVDGYYIPKKARVLVNAWAIGRDPNIWPDPEKFLPERFIGSDVDLHGHDYQLIPFGSGRRICAGLHLGLKMVQLIVAQLIHCFDWEFPNGMVPSDLDMTENFGLVTARAKHLMAIPTYRFQK